MKVIVYVEGPGDRLCLETLLAPLVGTNEAAGIRVQFVPMTRGDRKTALLTNAPAKAAHILMNDRDAWVVILPDLYPPNKAFAHTSCAEMQAGVTARFLAALERSGGERAAERFRVFCLIHDLEVLLLAAEESLLSLCGLAQSHWAKPVEEQNHHTPPKRIVETLIPHYEATVDGPRVLAAADYRVIAERCPDGFGRLVEVPRVGRQHLNRPHSLDPRTAGVPPDDGPASRRPGAHARRERVSRRDGGGPWAN